MPSMEDITVKCRGTVRSFYHGRVSRAESEKRLTAFSRKNVTKTGLYLVRKSDRMSDTYVLSFMGYSSELSHFIITKKAEDNRLSLGGLVFNTLHEVVAYYSTPGADLLKDEWLQYPVPPPPPSAQQQTDEPLDELAQLHRTTERPRRGPRQHLQRKKENQSMDNLLDKPNKGRKSMHETVEAIYNVAEQKGFKPRSMIDLTNRKYRTIGATRV